MRQKNRASVIILIVLILVSVTLAGATFYLYQKEHFKSISLKKELDELSQKEKAAEEKILESRNLISELQAKLQDAQSQVEALQDEVTKEKTATEERLAQIEQLKKSLENEKGTRAELEKKIAKAETDALALGAQLKDLESKKSELESKVKNLEDKAKQVQAQPQPQAQAQASVPESQGVELGKIVVSPEQPAAERTEKKEAAPSASSAEGKVLVVNKDYNFAVINLGSKDGVGIGNIFSVYNGNKHIGIIKVDRVHDSMSAASFVSQDMKDKIKEGDRVVLKTK